jgi:hypothetical protein
VAINSSHLKRVQRALREPDDRRLPGAEAERRPPVGGARWEKKVEQAWRSQLHLEASRLAIIWTHGDQAGVCASLGGSDQFR